MHYMAIRTADLHAASALDLKIKKTDNNLYEDLNSECSYLHVGIIVMRESNALKEALSAIISWSFNCIMNQ